MIATLIQKQRFDTQSDGRPRKGQKCYSPGAQTHIHVAASVTAMRIVVERYDCWV
jgi:hypothetical protein